MGKQKQTITLPRGLFVGNTAANKTINLVPGVESGKQQVLVSSRTSTGRSTPNPRHGSIQYPTSKKTRWRTGEEGGRAAAGHSTHWIPAFALADALHLKGNGAGLIGLARFTDGRGSH